MRLAETREAYEISVLSDGAAIYTTQTTDPTWTYVAELQDTHQRAVSATHWQISVAQISATQGPGYASYLSLVLPA